MNYLVQHYIDNTFHNDLSFMSVKCGKHEEIDFNNLYNFSNKLANCLLNNGISRQDRVAFCLKRSVNSIISILGILKSDAIYVPINHKSPIERCRNIINDCKPKVIICDENTVSKITEVISVNVNTITIIVIGNVDKKILI